MQAALKNVSDAAGAELGAELADLTLRFRGPRIAHALDDELHLLEARPQ